MSTYTECRQAALRLLEDPKLRIVTHGPAGLFTDIDVIMLAARDASLQDRPYSEAVWKEAQRETSQALGALFRGRQAVRYGPVVLPETDAGPDYLRIESRIAYGPASGPDRVVTPNGTFPAMFVETDTIGRSGRRLFANRSDLEPWSEQDFETGTRRRQNGPYEREILALRSELVSVQARLTQVNDENALLRERLRRAVTREEVESLVAERLADGLR